MDSYTYLCLLARLQNASTALDVAVLALSATEGDIYWQERVKHWESVVANCLDQLTP
jgi:hypothetical protein